MFLSPTEIQQLTGYKRPKNQRDWLSSRGWPFDLDANNRPVVSRNYTERRLSGETAEAVSEPDFSQVK